MLFFLNVVIYIGDEKTFKSIANIQKLLLFIRWELGTSKIDCGDEIAKNSCLFTFSSRKSTITVV